MLIIDLVYLSYDSDILHNLLGEMQRTGEKGYIQVAPGRYIELSFWPSEAANDEDYHDSGDTPE